MYSALHALYSVFRVRIVRNADHAGVDHSAVEHCLSSIKACDVRIELLYFGKSFRLYVSHGDQLKIGALAERHALGMTGAHITYTDNSKSYFLIHCYLSLMII